MSTSTIAVPSRFPATRDKLSNAEPLLSLVMSMELKAELLLDVLNSPRPMPNSISEAVISQIGVCRSTPNKDMNAMVIIKQPTVAIFPGLY